MQIYQYHITLEVPLGNRHGVLQIQVQDNTISGGLYLLGGCFSVFGTTVETGKCQIHGKFCSPKQEYLYQAEGFYDAEQIFLWLHLGYRIFRLIGYGTKQIVQKGEKENGLYRDDQQL